MSMKVSEINRGMYVEFVQATEIKCLSKSAYQKNHGTLAQWLFINSFNRS